MKGSLHSIETLGLLDGPGIRTVFFLKGCPLACKYCHNPDTQDTDGGQIYEVEDLVNIALKYKSYYEATGGGVTFSGGEPLLQGDFLLSCIKALKAEGIHVTLDTSGYGQKNTMSEIIKMVDLILLDIKHVSDSGYKNLIGVSMNGLNHFMTLLKKENTPVWVRHVMVPSYTDNEKSMDELLKISKEIVGHIEKIEILPYHKLGEQKYVQLNRQDLLKDVDEMNVEEAQAFETKINERLSHLKKE